MYAIAHCNGNDGVFSEWYIDERDISDLEEAKSKARQLRANNPISNGWFANVAVLSDNGNGKVLYTGMPYQLRDVPS